jgi:glycerol-3-phosphate acyltransferase PlsY
MIAAYSGDLRISSVLGLLTVTLWWTHRANIARLLAGTEGRIGAK